MFKLFSNVLFLHPFVCLFLFCVSVCPSIHLYDSGFVNLTVIELYVMQGGDMKVLYCFRNIIFCVDFHNSHILM